MNNYIIVNNIQLTTHLFCYIRMCSCYSANTFCGLVDKLLEGNIF